MTAPIATTVDAWGRQTCTQQARLLARQQTTAADATAVIVHVLYRMAGLTPPASGEAGCSGPLSTLPHCEPYSITRERRQ